MRDGSPTAKPRHPSRGTLRLLRLMGPAFVAAVAYVDPGNVAANLSAGAEFGYKLVWVLVLANAMAVVVQYLSAKLGIVSRASLPELIGSRLSRGKRIAFWIQAELVAVATDLAEVIGGAIALNILFDLPLLLGGLITGVISMGILAAQGKRRQHVFERVIIAFLLIIAVGFLAGLFVSPVSWSQTAGGLVPRFEGAHSVVLAASMLGATVMPHAIYLHSTLVRDRFGHVLEPDSAGPRARARITRLLRITRVDVVLGLILAGTVNIAMILIAAASLPGVEGTDTIQGAAAAISDHLGAGVGIAFAIGLLASGLASTSVGAYAGSEIMAGLLHKHVPILLRRVVTLIPALAILAAGVDPTWALVLSQVALSLGIPFALVPLVALTGQRRTMGERVNGPWLQALAWLIVAAIIALNVALVVMTVLGIG